MLYTAVAMLLLAGHPGEPEAANHPPVSVTVNAWLAPETVYLITSDEREEFKELNTDSERHSFVQQFWLRRGIEFEQEYARRVTQANQRFTVSGPGWQSDRGRALLILGVPDEVEEKPEMKAELWRYKDFEVRFSGFTPDGDYALVLPHGATRHRTMERLRIVTAP